MHCLSKTDKERRFRAEKSFTIRAAEDLCYSQETIEKLKSATTERELGRIMKDARLKDN